MLLLLGLCFSSDPALARPRLDHWMCFPDGFVPASPFPGELHSRVHPTRFPQGFGTFVALSFAAGYDSRRETEAASRERWHLTAASLWLLIKPASLPVPNWLYPIPLGNVGCCRAWNCREKGILISLRSCGGVASSWGLIGDTWVPLGHSPWHWQDLEPSQCSSSLGNLVVLSPDTFGKSQLLLAGKLMLNQAEVSSAPGLYNHLQLNFSLGILRQNQCFPSLFPKQLPWGIDLK